MEAQSLVYAVAATVVTAAAMAVLVVAAWLTPREDRGGGRLGRAAMPPQAAYPAQGRETEERPWDTR